MGAAAGRGERPARVKQVPKTAADLDAELEAFMNQPAPVSQTAAPDTRLAARGSLRASAALRNGADGALHAPLQDAAKKTEEAAAPTTTAPAGEGDVEMS